MTHTMTYRRVSRRLVILCTYRSVFYIQSTDIAYSSYKALTPFQAGSSDSGLIFFITPPYMYLLFFYFISFEFHLCSIQPFNGRTQLIKNKTFFISQLLLVDRTDDFLKLKNEYYFYLNQAFYVGHCNLPNMTRTRSMDMINIYYYILRANTHYAIFFSLENFPFRTVPTFGSLAASKAFTSAFVISSS